MVNFLAVTILRSLAAAQTVPVRGDVDANLEQHLRLIRAAADEGAELLVFPELSLTGYELDLADALAFSEDDPRLLPLIDAASTASMILIAGAPVRIGTELHIGAFILSPDGKIDIHTKHRLGAFSPDVSPDRIVPPAESTIFGPGDRTPLVPFHDELAAIGICAESLREAHPRAAAERVQSCTSRVTSAFHSTSIFGPGVPALIRATTCSEAGFTTSSVFACPAGGTHRPSM